MAATARLEIRVDPLSKARIERAAQLGGQHVSDFARAVLESKAEEVLALHEAVTGVPPQFFDDLLAALDAPDEPNPALRRAAARAHDIAAS